jgi:hypothetical protein
MLINSSMSKSANTKPSTSIPRGSVILRPSGPYTAESPPPMWPKSGLPSTRWAVMPAVEMVGWQHKTKVEASMAWTRERALAPWKRRSVSSPIQDKGERYKRGKRVSEPRKGNSGLCVGNKAIIHTFRTHTPGHLIFNPFLR